MRRELFGISASAHLARGEFLHIATPRRVGLRVLRRVVRKLKVAFPKARIVVRLDGGFAAPETFRVLEDLEVKYAVGIGKNKRLLRLAEPAMQRVRAKHEETGFVIRHYSSFRHAADSWKRKERRVVMKAEITVHPSREPRDNPRFVVVSRTPSKCSRARTTRAWLAIQIGRILGQNSRAAGKYKVRIREDTDRASGLAVRWTTEPAWSEWASLTEGLHAPRTSLDPLEWSAEDLWTSYMQLTDAEAAFRTHKHDLALRPVWHQKADRVRAHILVCFLAYVLWKTLAQWQAWSGLGQEPRKILEEIGRLQSADVVLPTTDGHELRLRCVVRPEKAQKILLDHLGLTLPKRLRPPGRVEM